MYYLMDEAPPKDSTWSLTLRQNIPLLGQNNGTKQQKE